MIALTLRVAAEAAEPVLARLVELVPAGFEQRDRAGGVEFVFYGDSASLPSPEELREAAGDALLAVEASTVADDWHERWKQWHQPIAVGTGARRVYVRPPWEPAVPDALDLVIDPGQAFGTGGHDTTRLCLELLLELEPAGSAADWGCGTGVLALAAARLGYSPVAAVDFDPAALEATRANALANEVSGLEVAEADLTVEPGPAADVVLANLLRPLLLSVAAGLVRRPPVLIASGLLRAEGDEVAGAFAARGMREAARREAGEWCALLLRAA